MHEHYEHYSADMIQKLDGLWGLVDERMNKRIADNILGLSVLDLGCGFGSLVAYLTDHGFTAVGIDLLADCVNAGLKRFPQADLRVACEGRLEFADGAFDTVVMKDTIHHIAAETDGYAFMREIARVCRRRAIIVDPNPVLPLRLARRIMKHVDPICSVGDATKMLGHAGFSVTNLSFSDITTLPLSGGYVGQSLAGPRWLQHAVMRIESELWWCFHLLKLERFLCWRYLLVADKAA